MKRYYAHYTKWECLTAGMYFSRKTKLDLVTRATELLGNEAAFAKSLKRVRDEWPISYAFHLSNVAFHRRAYLGRVGCCIQIGCTTDEVQEGWHMLTDEQQAAANKVADTFTREFELNYSQKQKGLFDA